MAEYRAYVVGNDGHVVSYEPLVCESDADATVWAKQLVDGHDIELWSGDRLVIRIDTIPSNFGRSAEFSRFLDIHGA
jgi:hypothetical protein